MEPPAKGTPKIEGYELIARGKTLGRESAREFADAVLTGENFRGVLTSCNWNPVVVFRAWRGSEHVSLVVCFQCTGGFNFLIRSDAEKPRREPLPFQFYGARSTMLRLAKEALPNSPVLRGIFALMLDCTD